MFNIDLEFATQFGYEILGDIGSGAFGHVFHAFSQQYKCNFAIKRVEACKFRKTEIDCMIAKHSHFIVNLYHYYYFKDYVYLVMEYCPDSLDNLLATIPYNNYKRLYEVACGVSACVLACHDLGIYHGDIKPANFLLDSYERIKITDFGLSNVTKDCLETTKFCGTLMFSSPEILKHVPHNKLDSDIWALGVTLFFIFTGRFPWPMDSKMHLVQAILNCTYDDSDIEDPFMRKLIRMCLSLDAGRRPTARYVHDAIKSQLQPQIKRTVTLFRPKSTIAVGTFPSLKKKLSRNLSY